MTDVGFGDLPVQALPITNVEDAQTIININGQYRAITNNNHLVYSQN